MKLQGIYDNYAKVIGKSELSRKEKQMAYLSFILEGGLNEQIIQEKSLPKESKV